MLFLPLLALAFQAGGLNAQALDSNGISLAEKVLAAERLMLVPGSLDFQVGPCDFILNGPPSFIAGDQTAAQWVRTVFHDFITANVSAGTGGLDASIGFESGRAENLGVVWFNESFIDRTIIGFNLFTSIFISTADFIAMGLAEAILSCDPNSPMMELRVGRIDALSAGPFGVPGPADGFASQKAAFARAGFNQTEMIQAIACGHSIGGVHGVNFPEVVGSRPTIGSSELDSFDDTPYVFDNNGVQGYLAGTGKAGGPLVNSANSTVRSDANIFKSDGNVTVTAMASSQSVFEQTCMKVFAKMINTVPSNVTLSAPIGPRKWITMKSFVDMNSTGGLTYSGSIGTYSKTGSPVTAPYTYTLSGGSTVSKTSQPGVQQGNTINTLNGAQRFPFFGNTTFYPFADNITSSTTTMNIGGVYSETINTKIFVIPSMSFANPNSGPTVLVRAALSTSLYSSGATLAGTLYYSTAFPGTTSPVYKKTTFTLTKWKVLGAYTIFSGTVSRPSADPEAIGGHASYIDVKLGTTQKSAKITVSSGLEGQVLTVCTNSDITTCP